MRRFGSAPRSNSIRTPSSDWVIKAMARGGTSKRRSVGALVAASTPSTSDNSSRTLNRSPQSASRGSAGGVVESDVAGRVPGGFNQTNQGRPKGLEIEGKSGARKNPDGTCQRGHDDWNPYGRCRTCQKMHDKKACERRKARNRGLIEADNLVD